MRLIDADKLKEELKVNDLGYQYYMLDNALTVDAIPVEWLIKKRDKNKKIVEKFGKEDLDIDFVAKYFYKRASHEMLMIEEILLDWRREIKKQELEK